MTSSVDEIFRRAIAEMQAGKIDAAERSFKQVIQSQPGHLPALDVLSILLARLGRRQEAEHYALRVLAAYDEVLRLKPNLAEPWLGRGHVLNRLGRNTEAIESCERAIAAKPDFAQAHLLRAKLLTELRRYDDALAGVDKLLVRAPGFTEAWLGRSNILFELKRYEKALAACERALALSPNLAEAWHGRGNALNGLKRYDEALAAYDKALALNPGFAAAWHGRGNVLNELKRYDDALAAYDKALAAAPDLAESWLGRGNLLSEIKRYDEAFAAFDRALALRPDLAEAQVGRGNIFFDLRQHNDALAAYDRALALRSEFAGAWLGHGNVLADVKQYDAALAAYDRALASDPDLAEAWFGRGNVFFDLKRYDDALAAYDRAVGLKPDLDYAAGARLSSKLYICDWTDLESETARLLVTIDDGKLSSVPFKILATPASAASQLQCARCFVQNQPAFPPMWQGEVYPHDRIRIAYLSADFHEHATAHLAAGLFEQHDRSRFDVTAISFGPDDKSLMRHRICQAFEYFVDVRDRSDQHIAELIHRLEIDIAVDLKGHTQNARLGILARRAAPIQVNYLGYPGTMGASYIDYIMADPTVIPAGDGAFYSEQVVWLPDSYQVNDNRRPISECTPTRQECGLPQTGFVFCCFNNVYKITPAIFGIWMRLLSATGNSVLWLFAPNSTAAANLRREAEQRGVSPERLVFADRADPADHLARHRHADLFLDTLPYNAHTTASDALWAGVPVLTCIGATFAGRVAASLLKAVGLDELITHSLRDYETLARKLAGDESRLAALKDRLVCHRTTYPLFDTERFVRHIEAAYVTMWQRYQRGEAPAGYGESHPIHIL